MEKLYVILPNKNLVSTLEKMLKVALDNIEYIIVNGEDNLTNLQNKKILFVSQVAKVGTDIAMLQFLSKRIETGEQCFKGSTGSIIIYSENQHGTKRTAQDIIYIANNLGCNFIGHPIVEVINSLENFLTWQKTLDLTLEEIAIKNSKELVQRLLLDNPSVIKKLNSYILISDSLHTRSDIFVSVGVLVTLIGVKLGLPPIIDPIASLVVSGFILHSAFEIFQSTSGILVDKAVIEDDKVKYVLTDFELVKDVHKIRSRGSENDLHIDMHIMVDPHISVEQSHDLIHEIERKIQEDINNSAQVIVHIEPYYPKVDV